jgi:hypothetical protein
MRTWTNFYLPRGYLVTVYSFFQKGITFTSEVRFQYRLFKTTFFFEIFPSRPSISSFFAYFNMASPSDIFITNTNYFQWKSHMEDLLRSKGLYQITLGKEEKNPLMMTSMPNGLIRTTKLVD